MPLISHDTHRFATAVEDAAEVDVDDAPPLIIGRVEERLKKLNAGVRVHDVEAPRLCECCIDKLATAGARGDVARDKRSSAAAGRDLVRSLLSSGLIDITDHDGCPVRCERGRTRTADAHRGASYDDRLSDELGHGAPSGRGSPSLQARILKC